MTESNGKKKKKVRLQPAKPFFHAYNIAQVLQLRRTLRETIMLEYGHPGIIPRGPEFQRLVQIVREALPVDIPWRTLEDVLRNLAGAKLTMDTADETAWRVAGNLPRLRRRFMVPPWRVQKIREWVPAQIISCRRERSSRQQMGALFSFLLQAGSACGRTSYRWWSVKQCRFYSRAFGFSRPTNAKGTRPCPYPYLVPEQLVGLRCYVLLEPHLCDQEPQFSQADWPKCVEAWNKETLRCRFRVDPGYACPQNFPQSLACHLCPVGTKRCRAATHRDDWQLAECPICRKKNYHEVGAAQCVDCTRAALYKKAKHD